MNKTRIGILRETKDPPDRRVPLTPVQCRELMDTYPELEIVVQPSENRCFTDWDFMAEQVPLTEDLTDCNILLGVKEVKTDTLLDNKTYLFFSHTAKKQPYNRGLLQEVIRKGIRLVDYEYLTDDQQVRVVAFGRWAGIVGAYNGLRALGERSGSFSLKPATSHRDLNELKEALSSLDLGQTRIVVTGGGRVAGGAVEILEAMGIWDLYPEDYLEETYDRAVYCRLDPWHYTSRRDGAEFEFDHFVASPGEYENAFLPYARKTDLFIASHFWDPASPVMLTRKDLQSPEIPISIIADISCDIDGPIASTIRASTIADPFYGYDPETGGESGAFGEGVVTVMAVDNLPGELPRDASEDFGKALKAHVLPELLGESDSGMIDRASITQDGRLTEFYTYLQDYLEGKE